MLASIPLRLRRHPLARPELANVMKAYSVGWCRLLLGRLEVNTMMRIIILVRPRVHLLARPLPIRIYISMRLCLHLLGRPARSNFFLEFSAAAFAG